MELGIFTKGLGNARHEETLLKLVKLLQSKNHKLYTSAELQEYLYRHGGFEQNIAIYTHFTANKKSLDMMLCVGGDGTILDTINIVRNSGIPILGINTGRLGFLANGQIDDLENMISQIETGNYTLDMRSILTVESNEDLFDYNFGLNDFVIHKNETSSMIVVHTYLNGEFMNSYWADGLIISTPTGSTGYSLSCGGPIIFPNSENFILTPIAPHNLNMRPVVVSDKFVISFEIEGRANNYMAGIDSRSRSISSKTQIAVRKADHKISLVRLPNDNFMETLRSKLNWGLDNRN